MAHTGKVPPAIILLKQTFSGIVLDVSFELLFTWLRMDWEAEFETSMSGRWKKTILNKVLRKEGSVNVEFAMVVDSENRDGR